MNTNNLQILEALETLAQAFPWDTVQIEINRLPEAKYRYTAWLCPNNFGGNFECASGDSVGDAVALLIERQAGKRDPDRARQEKLAGLRAQIAKLEAVVIGLPPYKPNRELAQINLPAVKEDIVV